MCSSYEGYSESNLRRAVNRTSNEKMLLYTKNTWILKLLLSVVTAGIEALVSGNKHEPGYIIVVVTVNAFELREVSLLMA
jgi:hypothetical protein